MVPQGAIVPQCPGCELSFCAGICGRCGDEGQVPRTASGDVQPAAEEAESTPNVPIAATNVECSFDNLSDESEFTPELEVEYRQSAAEAAGVSPEQVVITSVSVQLSVVTVITQVRFLSQDTRKVENFAQMVSADPSVLIQSSEMIQQMTTIQVNQSSITTGVVNLVPGTIPAGAANEPSGGGMAGISEMGELSDLQANGGLNETMSAEDTIAPLPVEAISVNVAKIPPTDVESEKQVLDLIESLKPVDAPAPATEEAEVAPSPEDAVGEATIDGLSFSPAPATAEGVAGVSESIGDAAATGDEDVADA